VDYLAYSEMPAEGSVAAALEECMAIAMLSPAVTANVSSIMCGGDLCCTCTMNCGGDYMYDEEACMDGCFSYPDGACAMELYGHHGDDDEEEDYGGDYEYGGDWDWDDMPPSMYSDPCDECLMECDELIDWEEMETITDQLMPTTAEGGATGATGATGGGYGEGDMEDLWESAGIDALFSEYEICTDSCHDVEHGACGGIWSEELHPCDACRMGCHGGPSGGGGGEPDWMDGEIAIGRPFLLHESDRVGGGGEGADGGCSSRRSVVLARAEEVEAAAASDWILPML
jgi:hypothetical protein